MSEYELAPFHHDVLPVGWSKAMLSLLAGLLPLVLSSALERLAKAHI